MHASPPVQVDRDSCTCYHNCHVSGVLHDASNLVLRGKGWGAEGGGEARWVAGATNGAGKHVLMFRTGGRDKKGGAFVYSQVLWLTSMCIRSQSAFSRFSPISYGTCCYGTD
jgi:hypothetical protein